MGWGGAEWLLTGSGALLGDEDVLELDGGDSQQPCACAEITGLNLLKG